VLSKFEKIVSPSIICEDYPRQDPNLFLSSNSPLAYSRASIIVHRNLSQAALKKSRVYKGGNHWIKVTFDSYPAAERACFYSPVEIDGHLVHCELWSNRPPTADVPILKGSETAKLLSRNDPKQTQTRTLPPSQAANFLSGKDSAIAGFERAMTLPRSHTLPDTQYAQPQDDISLASTTASSATALSPPDATPSGLRSRSVPHLPSQVTPARSTSDFMTAIPSVRKTTLRPISEALPNQPSFSERVIRSLPIIGWFVGGKGGDFISDGPLVKEDGSWDEKNSWYWGFWWWVDWAVGSDFCGLKED
jgi:hypothetical protein